MSKQFLSFILTAGATAALAFGQTKPSSADMRFMDKADQGNMAEVKLGQLAVDKASNPAVKEFGQRMVNDHTQANSQLKDIASRKGVSLPGSLDAKDQSTYDRLSKLSGGEFDRDYMRDMVKDHQSDVNEFRRESESAKDADVRSYAKQTLPKLEQHLTMAKQDSAQVGATSQR